jgi:hypothetical protein
MFFKDFLLLLFPLFRRLHTFEDLVLFVSQSSLMLFQSLRIPRLILYQHKHFLLHPHIFVAYCCPVAFNIVRYYCAIIASRLLVLHTYPPPRTNLEHNKLCAGLIIFCGWLSLGHRPADIGLYAMGHDFLVNRNYAILRAPGKLVNG